MATRPTDSQGGGEEGEGERERGGGRGRRRRRGTFDQLVGLINRSDELCERPSPHEAVLVSLQLGSGH
jgi:hypothetical protein